METALKDLKDLLASPSSCCTSSSSSSSSLSSSHVEFLLTQLFLTSTELQQVPITSMTPADDHTDIHMIIQSEDEVLAPYPSLHTCLVCNLLSVVSILIDGKRSRFIQKGFIPAVYLSCAMNYEIDYLPNSTPTLFSYEPLTLDHQGTCQQEALEYSEVQFALDPIFQSDWFSYFVHYFDMKDLFNLWKGNKFISSLPQYPKQMERGMSVTRNVTFHKSGISTFPMDLQTLNGNQMGCVVIFRRIDPQYELFGMWFTWVWINGCLHVIDRQNSQLSRSLEEAIQKLGWTDDSYHSEIFFAALKKELYFPSNQFPESASSDPENEAKESLREVLVEEISESAEREGGDETSVASLATGGIPSHHRKLIHQILHRTALVRSYPSHTNSAVTVKSYRIVELEYYYSSPEHPDPYVHLDSHQSHWMCWYFHRQNGKSYKGGTYKGLDITIGDIGSPIESTKSSHSRSKDVGGGAGGLLIRSIVNIETGEVIQGPCKVVNELLTSHNSTSLSVHELVGELQNAALSDSLPVPIASQDRLTFQRIKSNGEKILCSPRVGLTFRRVTPLVGKEYLMAPYRYTYSKIDFKANKSLLTILGTNLNKLLKSSSLSSSKSSLASAAEWMRNYQEGVRHRSEDDSKDMGSPGQEAFRRRMAKYCQSDWKVSELCYLYGYLIDTTRIKEMVAYDVERGISDDEG